MNDISERISKMPETAIFRRDYEQGGFTITQSLKVSDLKALVAERDRLLTAIDEIIKWEKTLEVESAVLKITAKALAEIRSEK